MNILHLAINRKRTRPLFKTFGLILLGLSILIPAGKAQVAPGKVPASKAVVSSVLDHSFRNPPAAYTMIQYAMSNKITASSAQVFKSYGFGGLQQGVAWNKNYLDDELAWDALLKDVNAAKKSGFRVWIHDEKGYPSGAAGGNVVKDHPEYENIGLVRIVKSGQGEGVFTFKVPDSLNIIKASIYPVINGLPDFNKSFDLPFKSVEIITQGIAGKWELSIFGVKVIDKNTQAQSTIRSFGQTGHYPNLLNKDADKRYVDLTYQGYADHIPDFSNKVELFYTGEPNLMKVYWQNDGSKAAYAYVPWEASLPAEFKKQHGYDLMPYLNSLYDGNSAHDKTIRLHYYQTVAQMFSSNYVGQITQWCKQHGVKSLGHMLLEEYMCMHVINTGDMIKALRNFDVPGCDVPIPNPKWHNWNYWMPKYISSAAYLERKPMVMALLDPIIGGNGTRNLTPEIKYIRRTVNMAYIAGINQVSTYINFNHYPAEEYKGLNEYVGRLSVLLRGAENEAPIAMYYPIETFQANYISSPDFWTKIVKSYTYLQDIQDSLASGILKNGLDFNYLTADAILNAKIINGELVSGTHHYKAIVMPKVEVLSLSVLRKLKKCSKNGIAVYWVGGTPDLGISEKEHNLVKNEAKSLVRNDNPLPELKRVSTDKKFDISIKSGAAHIFMGKYSKNEKNIYFIVNDAEGDAIIEANSAKRETIKLYDPANGEITETMLPCKKKIGPFSSLFIVE